ncbi:MAG: hypothetical protein KR126chlam1_00686 [Chlamydiae bacterium]|nr:hypothetical protein [Chlamydiota bacterium]
MRYFLPFFLLFCLAIGRLDRIFFKANDSFCTAFITPIWNRCPAFFTEIPDEVYPLLSQSFTYLTKGKQSFVFLSEDREWVLKFFRLPRYVRRGTHKGSAKSLPFLTQTMEGFKWSQDKLSEETGILYAHLQRTKGLPHTTQLIDRFGRSYLLDLNDLPFAIQRKGSLFLPSLSEMEEEEAKRMIEEAVLLYANLHQKGFTDNDAIFEKNIGIACGLPFIMDVGQLVPSSSLSPLQDYLLKMTVSLADYLAQDNSTLYSHYLETVKSL